MHGYCRLWRQGKESNTKHPRPAHHTGLSPTGSHTVGHGSHTAQHAEIILIKIVLKLHHFPKTLHWSQNLPLNFDYSPSDSETTGRVRGNLEIWGLLHCISKPREMVWSFLLSYQSFPLQKTGFTDTFQVQFSLSPSTAGSAWLQSHHHMRIRGWESTWSPALAVPHLLISPFPCYSPLPSTLWTHPGAQSNLLLS